MKPILFKLAFTALVVASIFLLAHGSAYADSKFSAAYNVTYQIQTSGTTSITQKIDLKNLTANFYATQYTLSIGATHIKNVAAVDSGGSTIPVTVSTDNNTTKITLAFNQKTVGLNKVMTFRINYDSDDIAVKNGFVWEVTIPKLASPESIDSYNLDLKAPKDIGSASSISPEPVRNDSDGDFNIYSFNKDQLTKSGVNASFGDHQVFNFNLKYHLANTRFFPVFQTISLPPDSENQTILYSKLTPKPAEITVDTDGNYLAKYRLEGNQKLEILLSGQVRVWSKPTNPPRTNWGDQDLSKFLSGDKYWETTNPAIVAKAKELKTASNIYNFVTTTLKYDYARASGKLERFGAAAALNQPTHAVCMEFTDLFVALARAAGIPAREVDGFAYTTNSKLKPRSFVGSDDQPKSDILHAWAQYWNKDEKRWVQIDPTWGSTTGGVDYFNKLDMNHFVFAIKGISSTTPAPAGSYKTDPSKQTGDVDISIAPDETAFSVSPNLSLDLGSSITAGLPFGGRIGVTNSGNSTIFAGKVDLHSKSISFSSATLGPVPPLSSVYIPLSGRTNDFGLSQSDDVQAQLTGTDATGSEVKIEARKSVQVIPIWLAIIPWLMALLAGVGLVLLIIKKWSLISSFTTTRIPWLLKIFPKA